MLDLETYGGIGLKGTGIERASCLFDENGTVKLPKMNRGTYATVYMIPNTDCVLRVSGMDDRYHVYMDQLDDLRMRGISKHAPKVYAWGVGYDAVVDREFYWSIIEELQDYTPGVQRLEGPLKLLDDVREGVDKCCDWEDWETLEVFTYETHLAGYAMNAADTLLAYSILTVIREEGDDVYLDNHSGNIMYRADGTPVLTDPFCEQYGYI